MAERRNPVLPVRANAAAAARVAPDSIIGRLTYTPARGDEPIGRIKRNLAKGETPHFKQVTHFSEWCAPAIAPVSQPSDMRLGQVARSQKQWLLEHLPESFLPDEDVESLLVEEITAAQETTTQPTSIRNTPLFAVGEIADTRGGRSVRTRQVLAVASGVSGNLVRLVSLAHEECVWTEADFKVDLHAASPQLAGEWCHDGGPISLIKFALDQQKNDSIRWLLVQNGVSTTVYEPELRMIPMRGTGVSSQVDQPVASQVFENPLFTIPCERTGGGLQADVSFTRHAEAARLPQLAIIDQAGHWSLWDVTGRRDIRPRNLTPVMKLCGDMVSGSIPKLPSSSMNELRSVHGILWLAFNGKNKSRALRRRKSRDGKEPEIPPPQRVLLLYSAKDLHLFDIADQQLHPVSHLLLSKPTHRILGVAPSGLEPAQVFVLTSTSLIWATVRDGKKETLSLDIIVSCPHQRDVNDPTLQLDISPWAYVNSHKACFVCVRSARDTEMTVFWLLNPQEPGSPVRYHRDLISLDVPAPFVGLTILPAARRMGADPTSDAGRAIRKVQMRFFQLLILGQGLDVRSALCAWSEEAGVFVPPPDGREVLEENENRRFKLLQKLTDAFAVPDEFDERAVFGKKGKGVTPVEGLDVGVERRVDFGLVARRLAATGAPEVGDEVDKMSVDGVDFGFIAEAVEREKEDGYMPRRSMLDLATALPAGKDLMELARECDVQQDALHRRADDWSFVPEARRPLIDFGPDDLVDKLRDLFLSSQPEDGNPARRHREEVLKNLAAEMSLSNIGLSSVPPSWDRPESQTELPSSLPFPSSPSLKSSQPSFPTPPKGKDKSEPEEQGDTVALRLRKYATLNTTPTIHGEPPLALTHWTLGGDPDAITWKPGQDLDAEAAIRRRREKIEARRRKAERLSQRIFGGEDSFLGDQSSQSLGGGSSQPMIMSTAAGGAGKRNSQRMSSQSQSQTPLRRAPWELASSQTPRMGGFGTPRAVRAGSPLRREYRGEEVGGKALGSSQVLGMGGSSQMLGVGTPSRGLSQLSQARATQLPQTQGQPQSQQQMLPGFLVGRLSFSPFKRSPAKKVKRKSELRMSGFR